MLNQIEKAKNFLKEKIKFKPETAVILGTGLNSLAEIIENPVNINYKEIPGFPVSTAPMHEGKLIAGNIQNKNVIFMQGRLHFYEGYSMPEVIFPIRVLKALGVKKLILTNASGSLNKELLPGDLVLIEDHINLMGTNPLIGENFEELGSRFPSMNDPYDKQMRNAALSISKENSFDLKSGVYVAVSGPSMETKAECLMMAKMGADLVGMSTVPEVIVGIHSGMKILAVSAVTNLSNIFHSEPHTQEEINKNAAKTRKNLENLIINLIKKIWKEKLCLQKI